MPFLNLLPSGNKALFFLSQFCYWYVKNTQQLQDLCPKQTSQAMVSHPVTWLVVDEPLWPAFMLYLIVLISWRKVLLSVYWGKSRECSMKTQWGPFYFIFPRVSQGKKLFFWPCWPRTAYKATITCHPSMPTFCFQHFVRCSFQHSTPSSEWSWISLS